MAYDAVQISNWFLERGQNDGRRLSIMALLKLSYLSHGWKLEIGKTPLFVNPIQAWQYGPVIPDVYNAFRKQGTYPEKTVECSGPDISPEDSKLLEEIWNKYGTKSASQLSEITHVKGGPWHQASELGGNYATIPDDLILRHYQEKRRLAIPRECESSRGRG